MEQEFKDLRGLLLVAASCKKPEQSEFEKLLGTLLKDIEAITRAKEANRKDREWFNHLSTIAEGAGCVGWVTIVSLSLVSGDGCWTISPVIAVAKARSVCQRNQGLDTILWKPCDQGVQGKVSRRWSGAGD